MRKIAVYGKGGSGKSTIVSNVATALARMKQRVLQVGCDPKRDSTRAHLDGRLLATVLERLGDGGSVPGPTGSSLLSDFIIAGRDGVDCVEAGGPEPGVGCAGRGIVLAIETLTDLGLFDAGYDVVFFDVLGDVVCGGFAMPIRKGFAEEIYLVVTGEFLSLYAANNICKGIARYSASGPARLAGLIGNLRGMEREEETISGFAERIGTVVVHSVPSSPLVPEAENARRTVVELAPRSSQARAYRSIARKVLDNRKLVIPRPLDDDEMERIASDLVRERRS